MEPLYDICFAGECLQEHDPQLVRQNLKTLFNANPATLDRLFSGRTQLLKRACDKKTALNYKQAMERAGAKAIVRRCEASPPKPNIDQNITKHTDDTDALSLAPSGSDVLRPEERATPIEANIDTSSIQLKPLGATLGDHQPTQEAAPDTTHLSISDLGEDIPTLVDTTAAVNPVISHIQLSPEGTDFSDCTPSNPPPLQIDTSSIELSPEGSEVLEKKYRKKDESSTQDTSHLSLEK